MTMRSLLAIVASVVLSQALASADTVANFTLPSGVTVRIVEAPFEASEFKIVGCTDHVPGCLINGRLPFGIAFDLPKTYVKSIVASFKNRSYQLDALGMFNAWGQRPLEVPGALRYFGGKCFDQKNCRFRGLFSDAGGAFVAEWIVVDGVSYRSVLTDSDDVMNLFREHIDPPEYE